MLAVLGTIWFLAKKWPFKNDHTCKYNRIFQTKNANRWWSVFERTLQVLDRRCRASLLLFRILFRCYRFVYILCDLILRPFAILPSVSCSCLVNALYLNGGRTNGDRVTLWFVVFSWVNLANNVKRFCGGNKGQEVISPRGVLWIKAFLPLIQNVWNTYK